MAENEIKNEMKNGKKKAIIAGSVAAGLTAVVAAVTIVSLTKPDLPNQDQSYSIKISSDFEGFKNSNLTIDKGTKIEDLREIIKAPTEGYEVEGLYQDLACTKPYSPETVITENMQVFIKFDLKKFTVTAYADTSKTQVLDTVTVKYGKEAELQTPVKGADKIAKSYEFAGWVDSMGNPVPLSNIKADTEVFASFVVTEYVEYTVGGIPSQVTITKGGDVVTKIEAGENLHYGDRVKIVYTPSTGHQMKTFTVSGAEAVDGAENWYEITGALSVTYTEEKIAYVVGDLPKQITILDSENNKVESGATLLYDDIITITYTPTAGYVMTEFEVSGAYPVEGLGAGENKYNVRGNITVTYAEIENPDIEYLNYEEYEDGYLVTGLNDDSIENIVIPAHYRGKKVYGTRDQYIGPTSIEYVFAFNEKIKTVLIEEGVTQIGIFTFGACTGLTSVTIPGSVKNIKHNAFERCTGLTSVTIPEGVNTLDSAAFACCTGLTSITIPGSVKNLGEQVFTDCNNLTSVTISEGVESIDSCAFENCKIKNVFIPSTVNSIGNVVFLKCQVEKIEVDERNTKYTSKDSLGNETNCIIDKETKTLVVGCKNTVIPSDGSVTSIGYSAFNECSGLTNITIPESVNSIGTFVFFNCVNLKTVTIENADIYKAATSTSDAGYLIAYATTVKVLASADDGTNTFLGDATKYTKTTETVDGKTYNVYTKK